VDINSLVVPPPKKVLPELTAWIDRAMRENDYSYEIFIDDGSTDGVAISKNWPPPTAALCGPNSGNYGESPAPE
jgi:hypothetical protein